MESVTDFSSRYIAFRAANPATAGQKTAEYLASRPEVAESGVMEDGTPYATLKTGEVWAFVDNRTPTPAPAPAPLDRGRGVGHTLPPGTKAAILNPLADAGWKSTFAQALKNRVTEAGYLVEGGVGRGTLEDWEQLKGLHFLYVDAHGVQVKKNGASRFGLVTSTEANPEVLARRAADFTSLNLFLTSLIKHDATTGRPQVIHRVAISDKWLAEQDFLAPKNMVFLNACHSGVLDVSKIGNVVKAGLLVEWPKQVSDKFAYEFADRFFGDLVTKPKPRLTWREVKNVLDKAGLLTDPETGAKINFEANIDPFDQFLPEIEYGIIFGPTPWEQNILQLNGVFGDLPGEVYDDAGPVSQLEVVSWTNNEIKARPKGPTNKVTVAIGRRVSNTYELPYWKISTRSGEAFSVDSWVSMGVYERDGKLRYVYSETGERPAGPRGPIRFLAAQDQKIYLALHTFGDFGSNDEIILRSPRGVETTLVPALSNAPRLKNRSHFEYFDLIELPLADRY
jgi:hypothetical protein